MPCWPIFGTSVLGATCMLGSRLVWIGATFGSLFCRADDLLTENFTLQLTAFSRRAPEFERNFYVMPFREAWHGLTAPFQRQDRTAHSPCRHWQRCLKSWLPAAGWCYTVARPRSLWFHTAQLFCQKVCRFFFTYIEIQCMRCITIFQSVAWIAWILSNHVPVHRWQAFVPASLLKLVIAKRFKEHRASTLRSVSSCELWKTVDRISEFPIHSSTSKSIQIMESF